MWLLFGATDGDEIVYVDMFSKLSARYPFVRFEPTLFQPSPAWRGRRGSVEEHVEALWRELAALGGVPHAYVCGLQPMVKAVRDVLRIDLAVPPAQIHIERYD